MCSMFLGTANAEKGDSEEESRKFSRLWERKESGDPGPDKMAVSRGERRTMVAYRANRSPNGT